MRLRRSTPDAPGIARKRRGKGFAYYVANGDVLSDDATLQRIKSLAIPPAWNEVWISPHVNGHIQAVGRDAAGRRQYIYHEAWQDERAEKSSTEYWNCHVGCPSYVRTSMRISTRGAPPAIGSSRWVSGCSTTAIFVPVETNTRMITTPTAWLRFSRSTCAAH